jgi:hypothetical protein
VEGYGSAPPWFRFHGGEPVPADLALGILLGELVVHGWDIAQALLLLAHPVAVERVRPGPVAGVVLDHDVEPRLVAAHRADDPADAVVLPLGRRYRVEPARRGLLDHDRAGRVDVPAAGRQERPPLGRLGVEHVAGQQDSVEGAFQPQGLDRRADGGQIGEVGQHRRGLVHAQHRVPEPGEGTQDAAGAAAELQDRGALGHGGVHDLRLAHRRQQRVEVDRAAVRGDLPWPRADVAAHQSPLAVAAEGAVPGGSPR